MSYRWHIFAVGIVDTGGKVVTGTGGKIAISVVDTGGAP
jgi:hypothetical protein